MQRKELVDAHSGRFSHVGEFSLLAQRSSRQFADLGKRLSAEFVAVPTGDPGYHEMLSRTARDRRAWSELGLTTIVFAACALEAFIYDYGVRHLGDYLVEHLDRLSFLKRFEVFTKLVTGSDFPKSEHVYEQLQQLKRSRDSIMHYKSSEYGHDGWNDARTRDQSFTDEVTSALATLIAVRDVFRRLHPSDMSVLALTAVDADDVGVRA